MSECNIDKACAKIVAESSNQEMGDLQQRLLSRNLSKNTKDLIETAEYQSDLPIHSKNKKEKSNIIKGTIEYTKRFMAAIACSSTEVLADSKLYDLTDTIVNAHRDATRKYIDYIKAERKKKTPIDKLKKFESFFLKNLGWKQKEKQFAITSVYYNYNALLQEVKNDEKTVNEYNYFIRFMNGLTRHSESPNIVQKTFRSATRNIRSNLLRNNIASAITNLTQLSTTIIPEFTTLEDRGKAIEYWAKGLFRQLSKEEIAEMQEEGIASQTVYDLVSEELEKMQDENYDPNKKTFDLFLLAEIPNQAAVYFAAKEQSKRENPNFTERQHRDFAIKMNQKLNFVRRPADVPEAYWTEDTASALALMTYVIGFTKLQVNSFRDLVSGDKKKTINAINKLGTFALLNLFFFGVSASIPAPLWIVIGLVGMFDPDKRIINGIKELQSNRWGGITGLANIDMSNSLRTNIVNPVPLFNDILQTTLDSWSKTFDIMAKDFQKEENPFQNPKFLRNLSRSAVNSYMFFNPVEVKGVSVGSAQIGKIFDATIRNMMGDQARTDFDTGVKYETEWFETLLRTIISRTASETRKTFISGEQIEGKRQEKLYKDRRQDIADLYAAGKIDEADTKFDKFLDNYGEDSDKLDKYISERISRRRTDALKDLIMLYNSDETKYQEEATKVINDLFGGDEEAFINRMEEMEAKMEEENN